MVSQTSRSTTAAETSGANATAGSNLQHYAIQVDSDGHGTHTFVKELLDRNWKNEELLTLLDNYLDDTLKTINFYAVVVQEYLNSPNNYQSLIQDGEEEVSWEAALNTSHHHFFHDLDGIYRQKLRMQDNLHSFQNELAQKLHRAKAWTKVSALAFTAAVLITSAAAAATARSPATMAAAAAAPVLLGTIGSWALSLLWKYKDGVKKHVEITGVMVFGAKIITKNLNNLRLSARELEFRTKRVSEMADSANAGEVRKKLVALMESFQELQGTAADFRRDIRLVRTLTLQIVIKHSDFITESNFHLVTKMLLEDLKFEVFQLQYDFRGLDRI